jgi:hypothetical protein
VTLTRAEIAAANQAAIGQRYGTLTVTGLTKSKRGYTMWAVRCDCGKETRRHGADLRRGLYLSCVACARLTRGVPSNPIGMKFGRLTVLARVPTGNGCAIWECRCDCGGIVRKKTYHLTQTKLPGCKSCSTERRGDARMKHGATRPGSEHARLWGVWGGMIERCSLTSKSKTRKDYALKGIRVCQEWQSFEAFRDWALANGYENGLTIERRSSDRGYSPDNCEWITRSENCRRARLVTNARAKLESSARPSAFGRSFPIEMFFGFC